MLKLGFKLKGYSTDIFSLNQNIKETKVEKEGAKERKTMEEMLKRKKRRQV